MREDGIMCSLWSKIFYFHTVDLSQSQNALIHKLCWIDTLIQAFFNVNQNDGIGVLNIARGRGSYFCKGVKVEASLSCDDRITVDRLLVGLVIVM